MTNINKKRKITIISFVVMIIMINFVVFYSSLLNLSSKKSTVQPTIKVPYQEKIIIEQKSLEKEKPIYKDKESDVFYKKDTYSDTKRNIEDNKSFSDERQKELKDEENSVLNKDLKDLEEIPEKEEPKKQIVKTVIRYKTIPAPQPKIETVKIGPISITTENAWINAILAIFSALIIYIGKKVIDLIFKRIENRTNTVSV